MSTSIEIGERILTCRTRLRFSQQEVADLIGIAPTQLYRYEAGRTKPRPVMADRIAEALGVSTAWLLTGEGNMERDEKDNTGLREEAKGFHIVPIEFSPREAANLKRYAKERGITVEQAIKMAMHWYMDSRKAEADEKPEEN